MKSKKISLIALALSLIFTLSACTNEAALYKAVKQQAKVEAYKGQTDIKFNLTAEGLSEENQMVFDIVKNVVNNTQVRVDQKVVAKNKNEDVKGKLYFTVKNKDQVNKATIWVDMNNEDKKNPKMIEIFQLPAQLKAVFGPEAAKKDYLVYDMNKMMVEAGATPADQEAMAKIMDWAVEVQPKIEKAMDSYMKDFKFDEKVITNKGTKTIDGEKLNMFEIKMNDKQMKDFIRYAVNKGLDDKEMGQIFAEYMDLVLGMAKTNGASATDLEDMNKGLEVMKDPKAMKEMFNGFMDEFDKINVLGKDGLVIELGVNEAGYIAYENVKVNFALDLEKLTASNENPEMRQKGKVNFKLEYTTKLDQINDKNLVVDMPELTPENSMDFMQLTKEIEKNAAALKQNSGALNTEVAK